MSLTALRRTAAGAAVLATAVTGAAAVPASGSADTGPAATSITIRALHGAVRPGGTDTITGALIVAGPGTPAGRTVTLEARPMGADAFTPGRRRRRRGPGRAPGDRDARCDHALPLALRRRHRRPPQPQRRRAGPGPYAAAPRHPDQHLALDPRGAPRGAARRCGRGARQAPRRAGPTPAPSGDPGVAYERHRLVDLRGRAPDPSTRRGRVPGRARHPDGVPPRLPRYAAPAARDQRHRARRRPPRPHHRGDADSGSTGATPPPSPAPSATTAHPSSVAP